MTKTTHEVSLDGWPDRVRWLLATCLGLGLAPLAPGSFGALLGIPIYVAIVVGTPATAHTWLIGVALLISCWVTIWLAPWAERYWQRKDSGNFVTDEVAGFLMTVLLFRVPSVWATVVWAYTVTRIIDVLKVPPAKRLEHLPAGWGVVADDLLGSVYAAALLHGLASWFPAWFQWG